MVQEAIVTKLLQENKAEVSVVRASACGKNCSSCDGCAFQNELKVVAFNPINANIGTKVQIESSTPAVFGAVLLVYLLPMICLIAAYLVAAAVGFKEGACIAVGFAGLFLGVAIMLLVNKCLKNKAGIEYTITKELS